MAGGKVNNQMEMPTARRTDRSIRVRVSQILEGAIALGGIEEIGVCVDARKRSARRSAVLIDEPVTAPVKP